MKRVLALCVLGVWSALCASDVVFETTQGKIVFALKPEIAPKACENFEGLVKKGYYNGVSFH